MRRRKWWFIGSALAFLAVCVGTWKWSERPSFDFLRNANLQFVTTNGANPGEVNIFYEVRANPGGVAVAARRELGPPAEEAVGRYHVWDLKDGRARKVVVFELPGGGRIAPHAIVNVFRKATFFDRLRLIYDNWRLAKARVP